MPRTRQQPGDQPPAQAPAHDGEVVSPGRAGMRGVHRGMGMHNGVHDDDVSSADAAERTEHTARKSRAGGMPVSNPGCTRGAQNIFRDETTARKRLGSALPAAPVPAKYWKKLETLRFPETSLAGITRIGCKGTLSASPRVSPFFQGGRRVPKHPCFVVDH